MTKRVLVTGGAGFIGSHVVESLLKRGYRVRVVDNLSKSIVRYARNSNIDFVKADLTDKRQTLKAFRGFDRVVHLAAKIGGIGYFHKYPATILSENNKMYSAVFEAAAELNYRRIVYVSSSMVFESSSRFPSKEADVTLIPPPVSAYGFSKLIGESYCRAFWDQYGLPYTIVRPFNAYGVKEMPGEEVGYSHVIPDLVKKILENKDPLPILGNGKQTRCFTHATDIARGIVLALENPKAENQDFNLGTEEETRILDLARTVFHLMRGPKAAFHYKLVPGFAYDIKRRVPDAGKARRVLGWRPEIKLAQALPEIVQWISQEISSK